MNDFLKKSRSEAISIWRAGVDAVQSDMLVRNQLHIRERQLVCGDFAHSLENVDRIVVVGGGKAGAGMATGLEQVFAESDLNHLPITGWINVPSDCVRELKHIRLHSARPCGKNEPTAEGVAGSQAILELVRSATERDLVICLISGGGSALLPLPVDGVTWQDKRLVTQRLSDAGANIHQLNTVRRQLSAIKGGGLARACTHPTSLSTGLAETPTMLSLILSDVIGDPLDVIASGPTVPNSTNVNDAIQVLKRLLPNRDAVPKSVRQYLRLKRAAFTGNDPVDFSHVTNVVLGNNQTAVEAAKSYAESIGYKVIVLPEKSDEGSAEDVARRLVATIANDATGTCILSGGEPTVRLVDVERRGKGGRNQQLVLAALLQLIKMRAERSDRSVSPSAISPFALLSAGTDGEDGPTDAAGGIVDERFVAKIAGSPKFAAAANEALLGNDAYSFLDAHEALLRTGPTHTNVCDLRVVLV